MHVMVIFTLWSHVDPVRLNSRTSFSLEFELGLVSIYLHPTSLTLHMFVNIYVQYQKIV